MDGFAQAYGAARERLLPMALGLERVSRQLDRPHAGWKQPLPIDLGAEGIESAERSQQRGSVALIPPQRGQRRSRRGALVQTGGDVVPQDGMRADLEKYLVLRLDQLSHRVVEEHRLAYVAVPIRCVQLRSFYPSAGHGRVERRRCGSRLEVAQAFERLRFKLLHLRAVVRHVHLQQAAELTGRIELSID